MAVSKRLAIGVVVAAAGALVTALVFIQDLTPRGEPGATDFTEDRTGAPDLRAAGDVVAKLNRRANALAARGRDEEALALLARALEVDPACAPAHYNRGRILHRRGACAAALEEYNTALALRPAYAKALTIRAILLARPGVADGADRALEDLTRAIELAPERTPAYYHRARIALALGRHGPARADLDRLLELDPLDRKARLLRSKARRALGDAAGAEEDSIRARRIEEAKSE